MNILLIPDKFKGSLTSYEVIAALKKGIKKFNDGYVIYDVVVSDGGDGFLDAIHQAENVNRVELVTKDPLGREQDSHYLFNETHQTAYIELANASGLSLLSSDERNPLITSTYGTGLQIKHALLNNAKKIYIGLGGSATNDGGIGIANALGYKFLDRNNQELQPIGKNLIHVNHIDATHVQSIKKAEFYAVNDVKNPLFGLNGAAYTYAKQKGANDEEVLLLDKGLKQLSAKVKEHLSKDMDSMEGAGAAGGTGYGLYAFCNAISIDGAEYVLQKSRIYEMLERGNIDLIITGEGKIDDQTMQGKLIMGVCKLSKKFDIPVIAICGQKSLNQNHEQNLGVNAIIEIADSFKTLQYNMENAAVLVENAIFEYLTANPNID